MLPSLMGYFVLDLNRCSIKTMNKLTRIASISALILSVMVGLVAETSAQTRNDREIRDAVRSLFSKIEDFETNLRYQMQSSSASSSDLSEISSEVRELRGTVQQFQDFYDRKRENRDDVNAIIASAKRIDAFMRSDPQNRQVEGDWAGVKRQIDRLGNNYGITTRWDSSSPGPLTKPTPDRQPKISAVTVGLSGTYDLDNARSENIDEIVEDARVNNVDRAADLRSKLTPPQQIAIDVRGNQVTLATTDAAPITFTADGREKTEQQNGQNIRVRATLSADKLVVTSLGGETDYTITFESENGGKGLKVSRRITTDYLSQTVFSESVYNKTDSVASLGINTGGSVSDADSGGYSDNDTSTGVSNGGTGTTTTGRTNVPTAVTSRPGNYTVPNGVTIVGVLENELNTKVSQNNDRFRMTVQSPDEFRGAIVEGYVTGLNRSGTVTGDPKMVLSFEKITLRNGDVFDFAGNLQSVQAINGKKVAVDNEGTIKGESQTRQTAKRGGIGAGIGAVIGAIAGGGKGAAIGAIIGAGGGAGTVAIQGKTDIQLQQGSTITVVSSSPTR
jgi:hypothetical protein